MRRKQLIMDLFYDSVFLNIWSAEQKSSSYLLKTSQNFIKFYCKKCYIQDIVFLIKTLRELQTLYT